MQKGSVQTTFPAMPTFMPFLFLIIMQTSTVSADIIVKNTYDPINTTSTDKGTVDNRVTAYRTAVFNFKSINCPADIMEIIDRRFQWGMNQIPYAAIIPPDEMKEILSSYNKDERCYDARCAVEYGQLLKADKVIIGFVGKLEDKSKEFLGVDDGDQYIYEIKRAGRYRIVVVLYDTAQQRRLVAFEEIAKEKDLKKHVDIIVRKLRDYFAKMYRDDERKRLKPKQELEKPEKEAPVKKKTDEEKTIEVKEKLPVIPMISLTGSCMVPHGRFKKIVNAAFGVNVYFGLSNLLFKNMTMLISGTYFCASIKNGVKSYSSVFVGLSAGYTVMLPKNFILLPAVGGGYHFHFIRDDYPYGAREYYDPQITVSCEVGYSFYKNIYITLTPSYNIFFEHGNKGNYFGINLGLKYVFYAR